MGYKINAIKGISWMTGLQTVTRGLTFLKIAVLARILNPSQFGVFGIASLLLALLEILTETGINVILVQSKKNISEYIDSAWVISIVRGLVIFLAIIIFSPLIIMFFNSPNALGIILFISLSPLIRGFINPAVVNLQKELKFKYEFILRSTLFSVDAAAAIIFALITHSVYSLAIGLIVSAIVEVILSFAVVKPTPKLKFNYVQAKEIFHKGKWVTGYGIFNYFGENGDNFAVGKILNVSSLGIYQMAYRIAILPITEVSDVINKVIFPVYSKIDEDKKRLFSAFLKTTLLNAFGTTVLGLIIFIFSEEIIKILLGSQWLAAAGIIKTLAVFGILKSFFSPASVVFLATEKQKFLTIILFVRLAILLITVVPLILTFGLIGAAYSQIISVLFEYPLIIYFLIKTFKI